MEAPPYKGSEWKRPKYISENVWRCVLATLDSKLDTETFFGRPDS